MSNQFTRWMFEADGDPPDIESEPDETQDQNNMDDSSAPPDITDDSPPPDIDMGNDGGFDDSGFDDTEFDDNTDENENSGDENENLQLPEKISVIMNNQLYQRYLSMINSIGTQISQMNDNGDVLFSIMKDGYSDLLNKLKKLDENVKLWMKNNFINEDYSKNLLFFNMCLNLLNLLNDSFDDKVKKGLKEISAE